MHDTPEIGLYWNCKLISGVPPIFKTTENGCSNNQSLQLIASRVFSRKYNYFYPRVDRGGEAGSLFDQFEILHAAIKSHSKIPFDYIMANFELGVYDTQDNRLILKSALENCLSSKGIMSLSWHRPSTIDEWINDSRKLVDLMGKDTPCVHHYNHDHFFVSKPVTFRLVIRDIFRSSILDQISSNNAHLLVESSHYSEKYAQFRYSDTLLSDLMQDSASIARDSRMSSYSLYVDSSIGRDDSFSLVQGEFIACAYFSLLFWSKILISKKPIPSYLARPDWPGLTQPLLKIKFCLPPTELFAHFDGIGDSSILFDIIKPLEISEYMFNSTQSQQDSTVDDIIINDFIRTRSFYFFKVIERVLIGDISVSSTMSIGGLFREYVLPSESHYYLESSSLVHAFLSSAPNYQQKKIIMSYRLVEVALLLVPTILNRVLLNMPVSQLSLHELPSVALDIE